METELLLPPPNESHLGYHHIPDDFLDPCKFEHSLSLFQDWLRYQRHLPQHYSKLVLSHFLRAAKLDLDKAKGRFEKYCYLSQTHKVLHANRGKTLERDLQVMDYVQMGAMPTHTPEGYRICMARVVEPNKGDPLSFYRCILNFADFRLHHDAFWNGNILVIEASDVGPEFYAKIFTAMTITFVKCMLDAYPFRITKVIVASVHPIFIKGYGFVRNHLPKKMRYRVCFLKDVTEISKHIPLAYLPEEYNGELRSLNDLANDWRRLFLNNIQFFKTLDEIKPFGPIPPKLPRDNYDLGIDGSFRQLNID